MYNEGKQEKAHDITDMKSRFEGDQEQVLAHKDTSASQVMWEPRAQGSKQLPSHLYRCHTQCTTAGIESWLGYWSEGLHSLRVCGQYCRGKRDVSVDRRLGPV